MSDETKMINIPSLAFKIKVPNIPNFIFSEKGHMKFSIEDFSDTTLDFIAENWKLQLIETAKKRRKNK